MLRFEDDEGNQPVLLYFESEKKYKSNMPPKKSISLAKCFSINRKPDPRQDYIIAIYTESEMFCIVADCEVSCIEWLEALQDSITKPVKDSDGTVHFSRKLFGMLSLKILVVLLH